MQYESRSKYLWWPAVLLLCVAALAVVARAGRAPEPQQDVIRLETRINQLEQRLYGIETSIRTLEHQSRLGNVSSRGVSQQDVALLTSQIQALQLRLVEDECGLAKLDERTLSPGARDTRRRSGGRNDPCRANFDLPLRLPEPR